MPHCLPITGSSSTDPVQVAVDTRVDAALERLAGVSLVTFGMDGSSVSAHRVFLRIIGSCGRGREYSQRQVRRRPGCCGRLSDPATRTP